MYRRPTFCVSVGFSFKLILSFYKDYILEHRTIPKSLRLEYQPSLLDFRPKSPRLNFLLVEFEILLDWTFYHDIYIASWDIYWVY